MDYVVFGIGFGSTLVLLGWALRTFGPGLRFREPEDGESVLSGEALLGKLSWTRFIIACGAVLGSGGALMVLATIATVIVGPSDRTGTIVVLSCFFLMLIAVCGWAWLYIGRYGTHGILPPRTQPASPLRSTHQASASARPRPREDAFIGPPAPQPAPVAEEPVVEPSYVAAEPEDAVLEEETIVEAADAADAEGAPEHVAAGEPAGAVQTVAVSEPDVPDEDVVVRDDHHEPAPAEEPIERPEAPTVDEDGSETYVEVLPRTSPEESGRAEALRNLRMRRNSRLSSDEP